MKDPWYSKQLVRFGLLMVILIAGLAVQECRGQDTNRSMEPLDNVTYGELVAPYDTYITLQNSISTNQFNIELYNDGIRVKGTEWNDDFAYFSVWKSTIWIDDEGGDKIPAKQCRAFSTKGYQYIIRIVFFNELTRLDIFPFVNTEQGGTFYVSTPIPKEPDADIDEEWENYKEANKEFRKIAGEIWEMYKEHKAQ